MKRKTRLMTNDALLDGEYSMDSGKLDQTWADICAQIKSYNNIDPSQINAFFSRLHEIRMHYDSSSEGSKAEDFSFFCCGRSGTGRSNF